MQFSKRIQDIESSKTVALSARIHALKSQGKEIIELNVGEPDFHTHDFIKEATIQAIKENKTKYSLVPGVLQLRQNIAKQFPLEINEANVLVANGSKQIIFSVFQTLLNPEDEVIICSPYWVTIPESIKLAGGTPVVVEADDNHYLDITNIEKAITDKTKAIMINSPNNPTGVVYSKELLKKIAELALKNDLTIISDEAYDFLTFNDQEHIPICTLSNEIFKRTITIKSFSKTYAMTGFRIGYMIANSEVIKNVNKLQTHLTGNNCTFAQYGALAALDLDKDYLDEILKIFEKRSELAYNLFNEIFPSKKPEGAFYLFCNVKSYLGEKFKSSIDLAEYILEKANVALVPGEAFGTPGFLRLSFAASEENITEAYKRIKSIL